MKNLLIIFSVLFFICFVSLPVFSEAEIDEIIDQAEEYKLQEKFEEAYEKINEALKLDPDNIRAHVEYGSLLMEQDKFEDAILWFNKALTIESQIPLAHYALSVSYARKNSPNVILARKHLELAKSQGFRIPPWFYDYLNRVEKESNN